jgi:hypothetical protein
MVFAQSDVIPDIFRNTMDLPALRDPRSPRVDQPRAPLQPLLTRLSHRWRHDDNMFVESKSYRTLASENSLRSCAATIPQPESGGSAPVQTETQTIGLEHYASKKDLLLLVANKTPKDSLMSRTRKWIPKFMRRTGTRQRDAVLVDILQ